MVSVKLILLLKIFFVYSEENCGKVSFSSGLVVNGDDALPGEFPFMVALYKNSNGKFFCGGNLLTHQHILTVAHCFIRKQDTKMLNAEDILVALGKYNIENKNEGDEVYVKVQNLIIHDDWKPSKDDYDGDLAILVLAKYVEFTQFIKPICLPHREWAKNDLKGGTIVGWGFSEKSSFSKPEATPRKTSIEAPPTNEDCFFLHKELLPLSSKRTFCAGGKDTGPCSGDSGGGFFISVDSTWYLQGIISASSINNDRQCDVTKYAVYSNVIKYLDWIYKNIETSKPIIQTINAPKITPTHSNSNKKFTCGEQRNDDLKNSFPWTAAHFYKGRGFICGGSLVSHKIVVTAAHCIHDKFSTRLKEYDSTYYLGKYDISNSREDVTISGVDMFITHNDWNPFDDRYEGDIAFAILTKTIIFNIAIQPICISNESKNELDGVEGIVAGWGITHHKIRTNLLKSIKMNIVNNKKCTASNIALWEIMSNSSFCAGNGKEGTVCRGDGGQGFVLKRGKQHYLKGIVSAGIADDEDDQFCSEKDYVLFTNAAQYSDLIYNYIDTYG